MRSHLLLAAVYLLWQGAAQAQYIPPNPYQPYILVDPNAPVQPWITYPTIGSWINDPTVVHLDPWNDGNGDIDPNNPWPRPILWISPYLQNGTTLIMAAPSNLRNVRVSLALDNVPLPDAIRKLFDQAPKDCSVELDKDLPKDTRITLHAKNIKFLTALNAISEQADLAWIPSLRPGGPNAPSKSVIRLSKAPPESKDSHGILLYNGDGSGNIYLPYNNYWPNNNWNYNFPSARPWRIDPSHNNNYWKKDDSNKPVPFLYNWSLGGNNPQNGGRYRLYTWPQVTDPKQFQYYWQENSKKPFFVDPKNQLFLEPIKPAPEGRLHLETDPDEILSNPDVLYTVPNLQIQTVPEKIQIDGSTIAPLYYPLERSNTAPLDLHVAPSYTVKPLHMQLDRSQSLVYKVTEQEEHATFTCPHCKKQITIVRKKTSQQRPAAQNDWHFCPNCGKPVR
jgi:hypothetical protein